MCTPCCPAAPTAWPTPHSGARRELPSGVLEQVARARERTLQQISLRKSGAKQAGPAGLCPRLGRGAPQESLTGSVRPLPLIQHHAA